MTTELLFLALGVVAGALTQRVTGIGFALVCAPLLVLIAGPFEGVVLSNLLRGPGGAAVAGASSGFMNVTAGVGGPAIVLYAVSTKWEHRTFVATFRFYSICTNLASLVAKGGLPHVSAVALVVSFGALAGAVFTVVKGVLSW